LLGNRSDLIADLGCDFDSMAQRLQEHSFAQRRLVHEVSHELRSPLTRLQLAIGLAQRDPQKLAANLDRIESESLKLQELLENMLMLAQLQPGSALPREEIDLRELIIAIARDARFEAKAQQRDVILYGEDRCFASVNATLLSRAFDNILRNAIKYTAPATVVDIFIYRDDENFCARVCDCGPGVDASAMPLLFEPFYRAAMQRPDTHGYGLGLAIARGAIELHGGSITASNRRGGGLQMLIVLPLSQIIGD
jgi:two-component system OmpR family sensor kinase